MASFAYIGSPNTNLICCICRLPYTTPVTTQSCVHTFCQDCILQAITHSAQCPIDRTPLSAEELSPANPIIRSLVEELLVECPHQPDGCSHTCQRQLLASHLQDDCKYVLIPCAEEDCEEMVPRGRLEEHLRTSCKSRSAGEKVELNRTKDNSELQTDYPTTSTTPVCEHCNSEIPAAELAIHKDSCPDYPTPCTHSTHGCPWKGPRHSLSNSHIPACPFEAIKGFLQITTSKFATFSQENILLRQKIEGLERSVKDLKKEASSVKAALGPWYQQAVDEGARRRSSVSPPAFVPVVPSTPLDYPEHPVPLSAISVERSPVGLTSNDLAPYFPPEADQPTRPRTHRPSASMSHLLDLHNSYASSSSNARSIPQTAVAPVNLSTTLEGSLNSLRESVVTLSASVDSLARRNEIALSSESMRVNEELLALRVNMNGLRIQIHAIMADRNAQVTGRVPGSEVGASGLFEGGWMPNRPHPPQMYNPSAPSITKL